MEDVIGYKDEKEKKVKTLFCRMDDSMISRLKEIRRRTGISTSEVIRESVRRLLQEIDNANGNFMMKI